MALCESGSNINIIQKRLIPENKLKLIHSSDLKSVISQKGKLIKLDQKIIFPLTTVFHDLFKTEFYVIDKEDMNHKVLLGKPALKKMKIYDKILKFKQDRLLTKAKTNSTASSTK